MLDISALYKSFTIKWVQRFLDNNILHPWKLFLKRYLQPVGGKLIFHCNFDLDYLPLNLPPFYCNMLHVWSELQNSKTLPPANEVIWNNSKIIINKKSIFSPIFFSLNLIYISDIFNEFGKIRHFNKYYNGKVLFLQSLQNGKKPTLL